MMAFSLRFQQPGSELETVLELLTASADAAEIGGAVFSFATAEGVRLLLEDEAFKALLDRGEFYLIVGVDAVTVPAALDLLRQAEEEHVSLRVRVFYHETSGVLFHPKLAWFAMEGVGRVLVGSANLTRGGLLKNWEAVGRSELDTKGLATLLAQWERWLDDNQHNLLPVGDPRVIARARRNETDRRRRHEEIEVEAADTEVGVVDPDTPVLVAEIPRSDVRWKQANFDLQTYQEFFQLSPGLHRRVVLIPVAQDGSVGDPEVRQGVSVKSHNFRLELGQATGRNYPETGRPIGVFLRIGTRQFRYRLLMPGEDDHAAVAAMLSSRWEGRKDRIKRVRLRADELVDVIPGFAF